MKTLGIILMLPAIVLATVVVCLWIGALGSLLVSGWFHKFSVEVANLIMIGIVAMFFVGLTIVRML